MLVGQVAAISIVIQTHTRCEIQPLNFGSLTLFRCRKWAYSVVKNNSRVALFCHVTTFHLLPDEPSEFTYKWADCSRHSGSLDYGGERVSLCFGTSAESLGQGKGKHSKLTPTRRRLRPGPGVWQRRILGKIKLRRRVENVQGGACERPGMDKYSCFYTIY